MAKSRARKFAELLDSSDNVKSSRLTNAQSNLSTLGTITTVDGTNDKVVVRDDTNGEMKLATITNAALQGPQGIQGIQGPAGATGATGPAGATGATGATGAAGAAGAAGSGVAPNVSHRTGNTGGNGWATKYFNVITMTAGKKYLLHVQGYFRGKNGYGNFFGNGYLGLNQQVTSTQGTYGKWEITGSHTVHHNNNHTAVVTANATCTLRFVTYAYYHPDQQFYTKPAGGVEGANVWALQLN